jgi:hypothetical protein
MIDSILKPVASRLPRKGIKRIALGSLILLLIFVVGWAYRSFWRPIGHTFHRENAPSAERLFEPPSFIYGSSIHVWAYRGQEGLTDVFVTGHADAPTCRDMTGLVFNAYLQKQDEPTDLFVAGAARLRVRRVQADPNDPKLHRYAFLLMQERIDEAVMAEVSRVPTQGTNGQTAIEEASAKVDDDRKQVKTLESDPTVAQYLGAVKSRYALDALVTEAANVAKSSGLVELHTLPTELAEEAEQRIKKLAEGKEPGLVRFDDLLSKYKVPNAVILSDVLVLGSGKPLTIRIPLSDLSADGFEEARKLNRNEVQSSMVGDAERRRHFYQEQQEKFTDEERECRLATPRELEETVTLNEVCTADGICYSSNDKTRITRREYCAAYVPRNMNTVKQWMAGVETLLKDIQEDEARSGDSRIDVMNHATLVDSMLRDWKLPVARSQEAFDYWREKRRRPVWEAIDRALREMGSSSEELNGEQLVFSVRVAGNELIIQPVHIVDLARGIVVSVPKSRMTRIVDAWSERSPTMLQKQEASEEHIKQVTTDALLAAKNGDSTGGEKALLKALAARPAVAFQVVEQNWSKMFRNDAAFRSELAPKVKQIALQQERLALIDDIFNSPEVKQDDKVFLRRLSEELQADPGLPIDLHMALVMRVATTLSAISQGLAKQGKAGQPFSQWQVMETVLHNRSIKNPPNATSDDDDPETATFSLQLPKSGPSNALLRNAAFIFEKYYDLDPEKMLKSSLATIEQRDHQYLETALRTHATPGSSKEMRALLQGGEVGVAEWDAAELDGVRTQLVQRSHALQAEEMLWTDKNPDPARIAEELEKAKRLDTHGTNRFFQSSTERLDGFVKSGKTPDTLARVELAQTIEAGSREILLRAEQRLKNPKTTYSAMLSDHARLQARLKFEANQYGEAFDTLFADSTSVSLYHPDLNWKSNSDFSDPGASIETACADRKVTVQAVKGGRRFEVLQLNGLPDVDGCTLASEIQHRWGPSGFGHFYEQVLVTRVPVRQEARNIQQLLASERVRLALVKAMVFSEIPPARDLIPVVSVKHTETSGDVVDGYRIPGLEELIQTIKKRYAITVN